MELNGPVTLRYFRYPGCSSKTISLSKLSFGSVSKALVNAPGPRESQYGQSEYTMKTIEKSESRDTPGKASIIIFGAPFTTRPFPSVLSALRRGFVHSVKLSARALAVSGLRREILSRSPMEAPGGVNIVFHSDSSGRGGRADRGVSLGLEAEVEYGEQSKVVGRIRTVRVDEKDVRLKPGRGARFSDDLRPQALGNIVLLDPHALEVGDEVVARDGIELGLGSRP